MSSPDPVLRRVAVVANPTSGRHRAGVLGLELGRELRARGHEVLDVRAADGPGALARLRPLAVGGELDAVVAIGGDGTAHWVANACAGTSAAVLIVAAGTGNDNATTLGMPRVRTPADLPAVVQRLTAGRTASMDLGRVTHPTGDRHWLGVLGAGFDTVVNARGRRLTLVNGTPRYLAAVAAELPRFSGIPYAVTVDGQRIDTEAMLVAVANGGAFGGGMRVCPDASVTDGLFDVLILHKISRLEFLTVFPRVFAGTHVRHPKVQVLRGRQVRLDAPDLAAEADGEELFALPLDLRIEPGALRVVTGDAELP